MRRGKPLGYVSTSRGRPKIHNIFVHPGLCEVPVDRLGWGGGHCELLKRSLRRVVWLSVPCLKRALIKNQAKRVVLFAVRLPHAKPQHGTAPITVSSPNVPIVRPQNKACSRRFPLDHAAKIVSHVHV